jgi:hypothetical protein
VIARSDVRFRTLFVAPRACKVVDSDISPNGWCKEYAMAD